MSKETKSKGHSITDSGRQNDLRFQKVMLSSAWLLAGVLLLTPWLGSLDRAVVARADLEIDTSRPVPSDPVLDRNEPSEVHVIVQAKDLGTAVDAVRSVGGTVTHELGIIKSVGAFLSTSQLQALQKDERITRVHENRGVEVSSTVDVNTVRDDFDEVSFSCNNGTRYWTSDWSEYDVAEPGPSGGNVKIAVGGLWLTDRPYTGTSPGVARTVDLTGGTFATLSFDFSTTSGVDYGTDKIAVEVLNDGGATYNIIEILDKFGGGPCPVRKTTTSRPLFLPKLPFDSVSTLTLAAGTSSLCWKMFKSHRMVVSTKATA